MMPIHYVGYVPLVSLVLVASATAAATWKGLTPTLYKLLRIGLVLNIVGWLIYIVPFLTLDYSLHEVYWNTSPGLPWWLRLAGSWAGGGGSLYLFSVIASIAGLLVMRRVVSLWTAVGIGIVVSTGIAAAWLNDAFTLLEYVPASGAGLNPLLKSVWIYPHPLLTFGGYALLAVASVAFLTGLQRKGWPVYEIGWSLLTLGMMVGGYWSYETFGWGGYWAWDPVETSQLMVWLVATLLPHLYVVSKTSLRFTSALLLSSVFTAMYVTRTGLSPLHSFAASTVGAASLLAVGVGGFAYAALAVYRDGLVIVKEVYSSIASRRLYQLGLAAASLALLAAALVVYASLFIPSILAGMDIPVSVPQMDQGIRFYHPILYPILLVLLASLPAAFIGKWLGWRGYIALLASTAAVSAVAGLAVASGVLVLAPLSPLTTNVLMAIGLPWAGIAAASTIAYIVLAGRSGLKHLLRDRLAPLSLLHLGFAVTALGILVSGTFAYNTAYLQEVVLKPGEEATLPGGVTLRLLGYEYGISDSVVDIYTSYVGRSTTYFYAQLALVTLANDVARIVKGFEEGKQLVNQNKLYKWVAEAIKEMPLVLGNFSQRVKASVEIIDLTTNATIVLALHEPVNITVKGVELAFDIVAGGREFNLTPIVRFRAFELTLPRNVSGFVPPALGVHHVVRVVLDENLTLDSGDVDIVLKEFTVAAEALVTAGRGEPIRVNGSRITGVNVVATVEEGLLEADGVTARLPLTLPEQVVIYAFASADEGFNKLLETLKRVGLYELLLDNTDIVELALREGCTASTVFLDTRCIAYVHAPRTVPESAWLDLTLEISYGGVVQKVNARIRFEAYGEVQGIHGLVYRVIRVPVGLDEVYVVFKPPMIESPLMGRSLSYHELLIYYLSQVFKELTPLERLALAAVMAGGYNVDFVSGMGREEAAGVLETSLLDLYILASTFNPENSSIVVKGVPIEVKVVPGVALVWLGPVIMAVAPILLAVSSAIGRGAR